MTSVTVEKPKVTRTGVFQVRSNGKVGVEATSDEHKVCLYLVGEGVGRCEWYPRASLDEIPPGSKLLFML